MKRNMNKNIDRMHIDRILEKTTSMPMKYPGAMTKSHRERMDFVRSENET
jgi:hypothetical protein